MLRAAAKLIKQAKSGVKAAAKSGRR